MKLSHLWLCHSNTALVFKAMCIYKHTHVSFVKISCHLKNLFHISEIGLFFLILCHGYVMITYIVEELLNCNLISQSSLLPTSLLEFVEMA